MEFIKLPNVLYFNCFCISLECFKKKIEKLIDDINIQLKIPKTKFYINMLFKNKNPLYYGYLFFEDVRYRNLILGLNEDGSERIERIINPEFEKDKEEIKEKYNKDDKSWADIMDEDDDLLEVETIINYLGPKFILDDITIIHTPDSIKIHVDIWKYKYIKKKETYKSKIDILNLKIEEFTKFLKDTIKENISTEVDKIEKIKNEIEKIENEKQNYIDKVQYIEDKNDESYIKDCGDSVKILFSCCRLKKDELKGIVLNKIISNRVTKNITEEHLFNIFEKYSSIKSENFNGQLKTYPQILITENRSDRDKNDITIVFSSSNYDSSEALFMNKKIIININNEDIELYFKYPTQYNSGYGGGRGNNYNKNGKYS